MADAEEGLDIPAAGAGLWAWFLELHQGRSYGDFGPAPLSWQDMDAWARLYGMRLTPYEISALKSMDTAYMAETARVNKAASRQRPDTRRQRQDKWTPRPR